MNGKHIERVIGQIRRIMPLRQYFVVAGPRSGTTWMQRTLNSHPQIYCTERRLFGEYADFVYDDGNATPRLRVTLDKFVSASLSHQNLPGYLHDKVILLFLRQLQKLERSFSGKRILVDKITPYIGTSEIVADHISRFCPGAGVIYLLRDGRDVATSGVFHWFNRELNTTRVLEFKQMRRKALEENRLADLDRFFTDDEIEEWALTWVEPLRTIQAMKERQHPVCLVRYENMIDDQESELKLVVEFLGGSVSQSNIEHCIEASSFEQMSGSRSRGDAAPTHHIRKGIVGDWKNYFVQRDGELFDHFAGKELLEYGYENDPKWYEKLPARFGFSNS